MAFAAPIVRPLPTFSGFWGGTVTYDDNVFRYSGRELDTFRHGGNPARFPIRSADDLDVSVWSKWLYRFRLGGIFARATVKTKWHGFVSNWEKSYGLAEAGLAARLRSGSEVGTSFLWMPSYLIRYMRRPRAQNAEYIACRFSEYLVKFHGLIPLSFFWLRPEYRFQYDDFQPVFDYYDTRAHRLGCQLGFTPAAGISLNTDYYYELAWANGPVPDISHRQHEWKAQLRAAPPQSRFDLEVEYALEARAYTTENPARLDSTHAGRRDRIETAGLEIGYRTGRNRFFLRYELGWREVSSPYSVSIEEIKQYRQSRLGVGMVLNSVRPQRGNEL